MGVRSSKRHPGTDDRQAQSFSGPVRLLAMLSERMSRTQAPLVSIGELVRELLREPDPLRYGVVLDRYTFPSHDLSPYLRWNQRHYTRTCVVRNDRFELLVICFESGQRTSVHDYDSEMAWIHPLMGEVVQEHFTKGAAGDLVNDRNERLVTGDLCSLTRDNSIHRFTNPGPGRAITLNLYVPPMNQWRVYDERTGAVRTQEPGHPR